MRRYFLFPFLLLTIIFLYQFFKTLRRKKGEWLSVDVRRAEFIMIEQIAWVADKNTILVFIWGGVNIFDKKVTHPNELFKASFEEYNPLKKTISSETFKEFWGLSEIFKEFQRIWKSYLTLHLTNLVWNVKTLTIAKRDFL